MMNNSDLREIEVQSKDDQIYDHFIYNKVSQPSVPFILQDLPGFSKIIYLNETANILVKALEEDPRLPGVLIYDNEHYVGYLSRRKVFEWLGKPYATELFLKRETKIFFQTIRYPQQILSSNMAIFEALEFAINRDVSYIYEPLVVMNENQQVILIDFQVLIIAQSRILTYSNQVIQKQLDIGTILTSSIKLDEVLRSIIESQYQFVHFENAAIYLCSNEYLSLELDYFNSKQFSKKILIKDCNLFQQILFSNLPISDIECGNFDDYCIFEPAGNYKAWMVVPLIFQHKIIGVISISKQNSNYFTKMDVQYINAISQYAAIAIHNAKNFQELGELNHNLENIVYQKTKDLQEMLIKTKEIEHAKSKFLGIVSHQVEIPLNHIRDVCNQIIFNPTQDKNFSTNIEEIKLVYDYSEKIKQVLERLQDLIQIDQNNLIDNFHIIDLGNLINNIVRHYNKKASLKKISIFVENIRDLPPIMGDRNAVKKVFDHIILNAISYTPHSSKITISGRALSVNQNYLGVEVVELRIKDDGYGIDEKYHEVIFEKFFRLDLNDHLFNEGHKALGLGLAIARGIIKAHQGALLVESVGYSLEKKHGCEFIILLPINQIRGN